MPATGRRRQALKVSEKVEQAQTVVLLKTIGADVYVLGTKRPTPTGTCPRCQGFVVLKDRKYFATHQTPGVSDLFAALPAKNGQPRRWLFNESKAVGGRPSPEQVAFRQVVLETGALHVLGGLDAVIATLIQEGYLSAGQVPHYRLPAGVRV